MIERRLAHYDSAERLANHKATVKMTGRYGGHVRVGRFLVPRHVFLEWTGTNGNPDLKLHCQWRDDGRPQVVEMTIGAKPDGRGVRAGDLEALNLDRLARMAFRDNAVIITEEPPGVLRLEPVEWTDERPSPDWWELDGDLNEAIASRRGARNRAELATVAEIFNQHRGRGALKAIAATLGVHERTAARRVKDAREAGLIPEAPTTKETRS